jgi:hypothetical protein
MLDMESLRGTLRQRFGFENFVQVRLRLQLFLGEMSLYFGRLVSENLFAINNLHFTAQILSLSLSLL